MLLFFSIALVDSYHDFFLEVSRVLEIFSIETSPQFIAGDFNIHMERQDELHSRQLLDTFNSYNLICCVDQPTHLLGGTLDLVFARCDQQISTTLIDPCLSDHKLIFWKVDLIRPSPTYRNIVYRPWKKLNIDCLRQVILNSSLCDPTEWNNFTCDQLTLLYEENIESALDQLIPQKSIKVRRRISDPWFDEDCRKAKRLLRRIEHHFYQRNSDIVSEFEWRVCKKAYYDLLKVKRRYFWSSKVYHDRNNPRELWNSINYLLGRNRASPNSTINAEDFVAHFSNKLALIRDQTNTTDSTAPEFSTTPGDCSFSTLPLISPKEIMSIILSLPNKQSCRDVIPTVILKDCVDLLAPFLAFLVNQCFKLGYFPTPLKLISVTPVLKKGCTDADNLSSYRPICNLSVLSKIMERIVVKHFVSYLNSNYLINVHQSAYRVYHSTETALLHLTSEVLTAMDDGKIALLASLDLSSAFDTVNHRVMLRRLSSSFGVSGLALQWFESFLCNRSMFYKFNGSSSGVVPVITGIPQGSVLGPTLFMLYIMDIIPLVQSHGLRIHVFADDIQVYGFSSPVNAQALASNMSSCLMVVDLWLKANDLLLNSMKTNVMYFGTRQRLNRIYTPPITVGDHIIQPSSTLRCLGVILDSTLSFKSHISKTLSLCFGVLRQLRSIRHSLSQPLTKTLIASLVFSRLDYCISLLAGLPNCDVSRLQSVIHASARLVYNLPKTSHISHVLHQLQWLPIHHRIHLRMVTIIFKCLCGLAPHYLSLHVKKVADHPNRSHLRSANTSTLLLPKLKLKSTEMRLFKSAACKSWNSLPSSVKLSISLESFKTSARNFYLDNF